MYILVSVSIVSIQADQSRPDEKIIGKLSKALFQSYQFRQINPDLRIPVKILQVLLSMFQSYQFRQINPDQQSRNSLHHKIRGFNRINSGRSIPTFNNPEFFRPWFDVSIVSIQADQSRQCKRLSYRTYDSSVSIVSIQADQSRRGRVPVSIVDKSRSFNRINSGRSIPTWKALTCQRLGSVVSIVSIQADQSRPSTTAFLSPVPKEFQSYQFRQINPDKVFGSYKNAALVEVSIVSIQADQSRHGYNIDELTGFSSRFQSYQFRQINPDFVKSKNS